MWPEQTAPCYPNHVSICISWSIYVARARLRWRQIKLFCIHTKTHIHVEQATYVARTPSYKQINSNLIVVGGFLCFSLVLFSFSPLFRAKCLCAACWWCCCCCYFIRCVGFHDRFGNLCTKVKVVFVIYLSHKIIELIHNTPVICHLNWVIQLCSTVMCAL